eukprot:4239824-Heterocapsa_arctica.AAC.1
MWRKLADVWVKTTNVAPAVCPPPGRAATPGPPASVLEEKGRAAALTIQRDNSLCNRNIITTTRAHTQETTVA